MILACPPVGATLYLIATYRDQAVVWVPLHFGLLSAALLAGWGLGWLATRG